MKKIWQKSLASMVSAALCLTAFVGCLTVNAATTYQGTITSDGAEVSETAESATVTLNIASPDAAMNVAAIAATTDFGTLTAVEVEGTNCKIDETKDLAKGKFYVDAIDNVAGFNTAAVILTFTKAEGLQKGNYPVTITYFAKESAATWNEDIVNLVVTGDINITVTSGHTHTWKFVSATPATYDSKYVETSKGTINLRCADCGIEESKELSFNMYSSLLTPSIDAGAETKILFSTRKDLIEKNGAPEANFIVINQTYVSGATNETVKTIADAKVSTDSSNRTVYTLPIGVPAKQMVDNFNGMVYTCVNGVWYNGYTVNTSIKDLAMSVVTSASTLEKTKKLCANLLVMGAQAQSYFNYNTQNLADADLVGDYATYIDTTVPELIKDDTNFNNPFQSGEVGFKTPAISMEDAVMIDYTILTTTYSGSEDLQNLKVVFSYIGSSGETITEEVTSLTPVTGGYSFSFGVAARYMRTPITATVYNGDTKVSADVVYGVESLLVQAMKPALQDFANAIINYSNAAALAFAQ